MPQIIIAEGFPDEEGFYLWKTLNSLGGLDYGVTYITEVARGWGWRGKDDSHGRERYFRCTGLAQPPLFKGFSPVLWQKLDENMDEVMFLTEEV